MTTTMMDFEYTYANANANANVNKKTTEPMDFQYDYNYSCTNTNTTEPMEIDTTDYIQPDAKYEAEPMDIEDTAYISIEPTDMDIEVPSKKRRYADVETYDDEHVYRPPSKKERSIRKGKRSQRHMMVVPAFLYFVV